MEQEPRREEESSEDVTPGEASGRRPVKSGKARRKETARLSDLQRQAVRMRVYDELTAAEIGRRLRPKRSLHTVREWFEYPCVREELARVQAEKGEKEREVARRELLAKPREEIRERAKGDSFYFMREVLGYDRLEERIHRPLCELLQDPKLNRKGIEFPRSWYKSTVASIGYPIWHACNVDVNVRCLLVQNTIDNASQKLASIRGHFEENEKLRDCYPEVLPGGKSRWTATQLCLTRPGKFPEPTFTAAGVRTRLTGRHYNLILQDDTAAPELQDLGEDQMVPPTVEQVKQAIGFHRLCLPLLVDVDDEMIVVGTRWFELDLLKWIKDHEPQYRWMSRAVKEDAEGRPDPQGTLVWPERFGEDHLEQLRAAVGPYFFSALYYNDPMPATDMVFRPEWLKYYEDDELEKEMAEDPDAWAHYTTLDAANDPALTKGTPDFNVVMTAARNRRTGKVVVRDYFRERCGPTRTVEALVGHVRRYRPINLGVESTGFQRMLGFAFKERMRAEGLNVNMEMLNTNYASKEARVQGLQPLFASGKIWMHRRHAALVQELLSFPRGKNDDAADALSMQLRMWGVTWGGVQVATREPEDPLSFESIVAGIRRRQREGAEFRLPAMDLLERGT